MKNRILFLLFLFAIINNSSYSQNGWTQLVDYPGSGRCSMSGFLFQSRGFTGLGYHNSISTTYIDFWAYDPTTHAWTQKANFPGGSRYINSSFCIGKYGFITLGANGSGYFNDLWQYDESTNLWTQKASFPGTSRYGAVAFGTDLKAYVGLGQHAAGGGPADYFQDFYEYDMAANTWTQKANFPSNGRFGAFSFCINGLFYVVGGRTETSLTSGWIWLKDMWAYNPITDTWSEKASYPGNGSWVYGFVINGKAYIGLGYNGVSNFKDFWKYDPISDSWTQLPDFPGYSRRACFNFAINNTGFMGCGIATNEYYDFWMYNDPSYASVDLNQGETNNIIIYPIPSTETIYIECTELQKVQIFNCNGNLCKEFIFNKCSMNNLIPLNEFIPGIYFVKIYTEKSIVTKKIVKINN